VTVIPLRSAELGRWRLAISDAVSRLHFSVQLGPDGSVLVAHMTSEADHEIASLTARALIETDRTLAADFLDRMAAPTVAILIAIAFRDRLLDLMTEAAVSTRSRPHALTLANASLAYAEALGLVLREVLDHKGPGDIRARAEGAR
jgi:hypothetical protein